MYSISYNLWTFTWFVHFKLPFRLKGTEKIHIEGFPSNIYSILCTWPRTNEITLLFKLIIKHFLLRFLSTRDFMVQKHWKDINRIQTFLKGSVMNRTGPSWKKGSLKIRCLVHFHYFCFLSTHLSKLDNNISNNFSEVKITLEFLNVHS